MAETQLSPFGKAIFREAKADLKEITPSLASAKHFDIGRSDSILNLIPPHLAERALKIPDEILRHKDLEGQAMPSRQDRRMRIRFWEEYENAASQRRAMELSNITEGTGLPSWPSYDLNLQNSPQLLAWFMTPPAGYRMLLQESMELGQERLREILALPLIPPGKTTPDARIGLLILQAIKFIDQRLYGAITQRNVNVNLTQPIPPGQATVRMEDLDKKIKELEDAMTEPFQSSSIVNAEVISDA